MSLFPDKDSRHAGEIFALFDAYIAGELDADSTARLSELLTSDPDARRQFVALAHIQSIAERFEDRQPDESAIGGLLSDIRKPAGAVVEPSTGAAATSVASQFGSLGSDAVSAAEETRLTWRQHLARQLHWTRHPGYFALAVTLLFVTCCLAFYSIVSSQMDPQRHHAENPTPDDGFVARVAWVKNPWWEGFKPSGRGMRAGQQLVLRRGLAEIHYTTGAIVILEAPTEFTVGIADESDSPPDTRHSPPATRHSRNSGYLKLGKIVARVEGHEAKGFTVEMPHARVEDLGTEFAVEVQDDGAAEVEVLAGQVELVGQPVGGGTGRRIRLKRDQGAFVEAGGGAIARRGKGNVQLAAAMQSRLKKFRRDPGAGASLTYRSTLNAPRIDADDIANLGDVSAHDLMIDEENFIYGLDRPGQGQSFTTGGNPGGYTLSAVTIQRNGDALTANNHEGHPRIAYRLRIAEVVGERITQVLVDDVTAPRRVAPPQQGEQQVTDPRPLGFITFSGFELHLNPNTSYAFEVVVPSEFHIGWELNRTGNDYRGGGAFSDGDNGAFGNSLKFIPDADRVFHVNIDAR